MIVIARSIGLKLLMILAIVVLWSVPQPQHGVAHATPVSCASGKAACAAHCKSHQKYRLTKICKGLVKSDRRQCVKHAQTKLKSCVNYCRSC